MLLPSYSIVAIVLLIAIYLGSMSARRCNITPVVGVKRPLERPQIH
jgi:hypothetical protein